MPNGHIYRQRLKSGQLSRWRAVIDVPDDSSDRRKQLTKSFDTKSEALIWLREISINPNSEALKVKDFLLEWIDNYKGFRQGTKSNCQVHIHRHLIPLIGELDLVKVTPQHIRELVNTLQDKGLEPATINRIIATARSGFQTAVDKGFILLNPFKGISAKSHQGSPKLTWTLREAQDFLTTLDSSPLDLVFRLLLLTGMRRGEVLALRWRDIDLAYGSISIRENLTLIGKSLVLGEPKSRTGTRRIQLDDDSIRKLKTHKVKSPADPGDFVFSRDGKALNPSAVSREFRKHLEVNNLKTIRLHDLRHTSATLGLAAGESIKEVSVRLGHSDIGITSKTYVVVPDSLAKQSTNRLSNLLNERTRVHA